MKKKKVKEFFLGALFTIKGIVRFYAMPALWKYSILPLLVLAVLYTAAIGGVLYMSGKMSSLLEKFCEHWHSLQALGSIVVSAIALFFVYFIVVTTICALYEAVGGLFFDSMVEKYEKITYGYYPDKQSLFTPVRFGLHTFIYGMNTTLLFMVFGIVGWFIPIVGQILLFCIVGYRFGVTYMAGAACNHGVQFRDFRRNLRKHMASVFGFGMQSYAVLLIPLSVIFVLPGLILGGVMLYHEIQPDTEIVIDPK